MSRIGIVVQRFGDDVFGGAEIHAAAAARSLATAHDVEVLTTCARDYTTWANVYPPGRDEVQGISVRRFPVVGERADDFDALSAYLYGGGADPAEEHQWLLAQGPVVPELIEHLRRAGDDYEALIFYTYLYYPTVLGLEAAPDRAILVPTCHDEPPLRFSIYRRLFRHAKVLLFLTPEEEALVLRRFPVEVSGTPRWILGAPVRPGVAERGPMPELLVQAGLDPERPFVVYVGRVDAGKGCGELIDNHRAWCSLEGRQVQLLLIGRHHMEVPDEPGLVAPGVLPEACKWWAYAQALFSVVPSRMESLCLAALESWSVGTPVLTVDGHVMAGHAIRSQGGLIYGNAYAYRIAAELLTRDDTLRRTLGSKGRRYVLEHYHPDHFDHVLREALDALP